MEKRKNPNVTPTKTKMAKWWRGLRSAATEVGNLPASPFGRSIRRIHQYGTMEAIPREVTGRGVSSRDRKSGRIPAVVLTRSILDSDASKRSVSRKQFLTADREQIKSIVESVGLAFFCSTTFKLEIRAGQGSCTLFESGRVIPRTIRRDQGTGEILNLVLVWVDDGEKLLVDVPLVFKGLDDSPGFNKGGSLKSLRSSLKLVGPVEHIPSKIQVDVSKLDIEDRVLMQDIVFHPSLKLLSKRESMPVCKLVAVEEPQALPT